MNGVVVMIVFIVAFVTVDVVDIMEAIKCHGYFFNMTHSYKFYNLYENYKTTSNILHWIEFNHNLRVLLFCFVLFCFVLGGVLC